MIILDITGSEGNQHKAYFLESAQDYINTGSIKGGSNEYQVDHPLDRYNDLRMTPQGK
jgi:hypothetical protein